MKIFVVRHANTKYNTNMMWQGRSDLELDEIGKKMARRLALRFSHENLIKIISSPLKRARQTAEEIAKVHGLNIEIEERLIEGELSLFEGKTTEEVLKRFPKELEEWRTNPYAKIEGLEPFASVYKRTEDFLGSLNTYIDGDIVIVTHAIVIRAIICYTLKLSLENFRNFLIGTASVSTIIVKENEWRLLTLNDRSHLGGEIL